MNFLHDVIVDTCSTDARNIIRSTSLVWRIYENFFTYMKQTETLSLWWITNYVTRYYDGAKAWVKSALANR
jgi:hypothetical protein